MNDRGNAPLQTCSPVLPQLNNMTPAGRSHTQLFIPCYAPILWCWSAMRIPLYVVGVLDPFHILVALVRALIEVSLLATFNVTLPWKRVYIKNTSYDAFLSSVALTLKWHHTEGLQDHSDTVLKAGGTQILETSFLTHMQTQAQRPQNHTLFSLQVDQPLM